MISTITVNYKTVDYLQTMLTSLYAHHQDRAIEVFVVENGSDDDLSEVQKLFPQVKYLFSKENLGFAGGCNLAIKQAVGDFVLLLNPDVLFDDDALYQIEDAMQANPEVGIGGVSLKNLDQTQQKCVWHFPRPLDQFLLLLKIPHIVPNIAPIAHWRFDSFDYSKSYDVDQVMGAFFCIRRSLLDQIGLLDEGYFMWYEEVDYCKRAVDARWKVHYFADIHVRHKKGSSFDRVETRWKQDVLRASIRRYMKKFYGDRMFWVFVIFEPLFRLLSLIASVVKPV